MSEEQVKALVLFCERVFSFILRFSSFYGRICNILKRSKKARQKEAITSHSSSFTYLSLICLYSLVYYM